MFTKTDGATVDDAEDLVMSMYSLLEYNSNYSDTTGSLGFYSKDEAADLGSTEAQPARNNNNAILRNAAIPESLEYLGNFWRSHEIPLVNCIIV